MQFSEEEVLFFNNVTKGERPFGVFLKTPPQEKAKAYRETVFETLCEKGILNKKKEISEAGVGVLLAWEEYRNCKKHLLFNRLCLGMLPARKAVGVIRTKGGYDISILDSEGIVAGLVKQYDFLRLGDTKGSYEMEKISYRRWAKEIQEYGENLLVYGEYFEKIPQKEEVYYWKGCVGYRYDMNTGYRRQIGSREMRLRILQNLGIGKE